MSAGLVSAVLEQVEPVEVFRVECLDGVLARLGMHRVRYETPWQGLMWRVYVGHVDVFVGSEARVWNWLEESGLVCTVTPDYDEATDGRFAMASFLSAVCGLVARARGEVLRREHLRSLALRRIGRPSVRRSSHA